MSDILLYFLIILLVLAVCCFAYFWYSGAFHKVVITTGRPPIRNLTIAYEFQTGPYQNMCPYFKKIYELAPNNRCIGLYYDNPDVVPANEIRWAVGTILSEGDELPNEEQKKMFLNKGYQLFEIPAVDNMVKCVFPFTTMLSNWLSIMKVYDPICKYIQERGLKADPYVTVYEKDKIHYLEPLEKTRDFYVPEARMKYNY